MLSAPLGRMIELLHVGPGKSPFPRQLGVADQPVGPEVGHANLELVFAFPDRSTDPDPERLCPDDSQVPAIESDLGKLLDLAQIKPEGPA